MTLGPSTVRPALELDKAVERMRKQNLTSLPVTRADGVLVGVLRCGDAEQACGCRKPRTTASGAPVR